MRKNGSFTRKPNWSGIPLTATKVNREGDEHPAEPAVAKLLVAAQVRFVRNVRIELESPPKELRRKGGREAVAYVPDFVFVSEDGRSPQRFTWTHDNGETEEIDGIECKGDFGPSTPRRERKQHHKTDVLRATRGINILVLSFDQVREYGQRGGLPLSRT